MAQEKSTQERLLNTIKAIIANPNNEWFANELRKALKVPSASSSSEVAQVEKELRFIREALNIRGNPSINYSFVKSPTVRNQLIVDNLRMENAAIDLDVKDESERFHNFCVNAFYQVEGLANYYYGVVLEGRTAQEIAEHIQNSALKSKYGKELSKYEKENGLNAIYISNKLTALGVDLNFEDKIGAGLYYLKELRNGSSHRGISPQMPITPQEIEKQRKKEYFWKNQSFKTIRTMLTTFSSIIQTDLSTNKYY